MYHRRRKRIAGLRVCYEPRWIMRLLLVELPECDGLVLCRIRCQSSMPGCCITANEHNASSVSIFNIFFFPIGNEWYGCRCNKRSTRIGCSAGSRYRCWFGSRCGIVARALGTVLHLFPKKKAGESTREHIQSTFTPTGRRPSHGLRTTGVHSASTRSGSEDGSSRGYI